MSVPEIKNLEQLLRQHLDPGKTIVASKVTRLTAPGENYGSEMLLVDLTLEDEHNHKDELSVVAKMTPESDFFREMFHVQVSFGLETAFYQTVVPTWQRFQRKFGVTKVIDSFAKFYGARRNLDNTDGLVDKDAVLVLENLKVKGYINVDRLTGFDLPTTLHLLSTIAKFHAVPLALKLQDIDTFNKIVKPFFACNNEQGPKPPLGDGFSLILKLLEAKSCKSLIPKLVKCLDNNMFMPLENFREPYATISHRDLWVNNMMVKFEDGKPVDSKIVDFQMYSYDTFAVDLTFFLMTSVEIGVLQTNLDTCLEHYHRVFTDTLQSLGCDVEPFSYAKFLNEVVYGVERELVHAVFMLCFVIQMNKPLKPPENMNAPPDLAQMSIRDETLDRVCWILEEFDRRGWLV